MTAQQWTAGRRNPGLTQVQAASSLGISQPYLSQLEKGQRVGGTELVERAAALYGLPATALPLPDSANLAGVGPDRLQKEFAALGYPGFAHARSRHKTNPALLVLTAVSQDDLDTRLVEALPWVMGAYTDLDWPWLRDRVKLLNAQNRLGYLVHLTSELQKRRSESGNPVEVVCGWRRDLEEARLAREDTLCRASMPQRERSWLRKHRPRAAAHWNLLTGLTVEQLPYASE
jgi:transcriptional regulator with XRE-family HTH domain